MSDAETSVDELKRIVADFVADRSWEQFHSPKNLSMSLAIEAAELMEHFQWISMDQSRTAADDPSKRQEISDEMADVLCYLLAMANEMDIDLAQSLREKMIKNAEKYPAEVYRGKYGEEDLEE